MVGKEILRPVTDRKRFLQRAVQLDAREEEKFPRYTLEADLDGREREWLNGSEHSSWDSHQ